MVDLERFCPVLLADGQRKSVMCEHAVLTDDLHPETPGCRLMGKLSLFHSSNVGRVGTIGYPIEN